MRCVEILRKILKTLHMYGTNVYMCVYRYIHKEMCWQTIYDFVLIALVSVRNARNWNEIRYEKSERAALWFHLVSIRYQYYLDIFLNVTKFT